MREFSFDTSTYLGIKENSPKIYGQSSNGLIFSPLNLIMTEIEKLIFVNIAEDPVYREIELQSLGADFGKGTVVILYRKDGKVDVYHSQGSKLISIMYEWGPNWEIIGEKEIEPMLAMSDSGLEAGLKITDQFNRIVEFRIKENQRNKKLMNLLAPLGYEYMTEPRHFPFLYLRKTTPVAFEGTDISISIDGKKRRASLIPKEIDGKRIYHTRFSEDSFLGLWNRNYHGKLNPVQADKLEENKCIIDNTEHTILVNSGHFEISKIKANSESHKIYFQFSPALPELFCLRQGTKIKGKFAGGADNNKGVMGGNYTVKRDAKGIRITMEPNEGWQPVPGKLWLKTYSWQADIKIQGDGLTMESKWSLNKGGLHEFFKER